MRRYRDNKSISVFAISGSHVVLLGLDTKTEAARKGLLGFSIHRTDHTEEEQYWLKGFKTFKETYEAPTPGSLVSTREHPIQGFMWGDYTAKPNHKYTYRIVPQYGKPDAMVAGEHVEVCISTVNEDNGFHAVFFNRGAAASQAYARRFGNKAPDSPQEFKWLSRGLEDAMLGFIGLAKGKRYALRGAVYEFNYIPVLEALREASKTGADVKIVYDHRIPNKRKKALADGTAQDKDKTVGEHSDDAIERVGIRKLMIPREQSPNNISHNKFLVLLMDGVPIQVWTGSTNFTMGGIFGQSNVGHIVRDRQIAQKYYEYWEKIATDPQLNDFRDFNAEHTPPDQSSLEEDWLFPLFSPRPTKEDPYLIDWYADRLDEASNTVNFTAAFGVNKEFVEVFKQDKPYLRYLLLDNSGSRQSSREATKAIRDKILNRVAVGATFSHESDVSGREDGVHQQGEQLHRWVDEKLTGLNVHVKYVHTKYLILDALSNDPIVISGSANFSKNSTVNNDENMIIARGNLRLTDMFLGEFMRLWNHMYMRDIAVRQAARPGSKKHESAYLVPDDSWMKRYFMEGSPHFAERELFSGKEHGGLGITFFDIDETIFHTSAHVIVMKGDQEVRRLDNQQYNTYKLKPGEYFDYREFRDADLFADTSKIIRPTLAKIKAMARNAFSKGSTLALLTARSRFEDMATFKQEFRKYGIPIEQMDINFAGDITNEAGSVAEAKKRIVMDYLSYGEYERARLVDDNMENLRAFLSIKHEAGVGGVTFEATHIKPDGTSREIKE
ncbi:MAG: hypothetical protein JSW54_00335 [Fidelibacterota bacterium]|nr:MAG: hypothetical protein JSW54_00335 [Candidatus Neomarinimicrobiota bacterium]